MICGSSNILARFMARVKLPEEFKNEKYEVLTVVDFYYRAMKKYERLNEVFQDKLDGADLILAVSEFRDLITSYKPDLGSDMVDWLTMFAMSCQSDVLFDKVSVSLEVACSVGFVKRQTLFNDMMSSGVLPDTGEKCDILDSIGAQEVLHSNSKCLALKSICNFVTSFCGYFDDILTKGQGSKKDFMAKVYADTEDCQSS